MTFRSLEGAELIYEADQPTKWWWIFRPSSNRGNCGITVGIHSANQHETLFFTIVDMSEQEIADLNLNYREEVELTDIVVTYSAIGRNDNYRLYASCYQEKRGPTYSPKLNQKLKIKNDTRR